MATIKTEIGKPSAQGVMKVYILITHAGTRKRIPTLITVTQKDLSRKTKRITTPYLRDKVEQLVSDYKRLINRLELDLTGEKITAEEIYDRITRKKHLPDFFEFAEDWLKGNKSDSNYICMLNAVEKYIGSRYLPFSAITYSFLTMFSNHLADRPRAQSHYLGLLRHIHNIARKTYNTDYETLISGSAIEQFHFPKQVLKGGRALDKETLIKVFRYKPKYTRDRIARDCAILSFCLMGMNAIDLYNVKTCKNWVVCYNRSKTKDRRSDGAYIEVFVDERIRPLFERYSDDTNLFCFHRHYANGNAFSGNISKGLKIIKESLGIDTLQFYQFRHTWATIARNDLGIDKYTIHEALNHIDEETRIDDVYIKKDFSRLHEANRKVLNYIWKLLGDDFTP